MMNTYRFSLNLCKIHLQFPFFFFPIYSFLPSTFSFILSFPSPLNPLPAISNGITSLHRTATVTFLEKTDLFWMRYQISIANCRGTDAIQKKKVAVNFLYNSNESTFPVTSLDYQTISTLPSFFLYLPLRQRTAW